MQLFLTGANRGIGLALTHQYLQRGNTVFASCRTPKNAVSLEQLKQQYPEHLHILELDVTNDEHIEAVGKQIEQTTDHLDVLINNAGVLLSGEHPGNLTSEGLLEVFHINSVAPVIIAQRLLPLLRKGTDPKLVNITSQLGSLTRKRYGGRYSYASSKAALNMFSRALAFDLKSDGIITVMVHPGWVATDMGGGGAPLSSDYSAECLVDLIDGLTMNDLGRFMQWDGSDLPW